MRQREETKAVVGRALADQLQVSDVGRQVGRRRTDVRPEVKRLALRDHKRSLPLRHASADVLKGLVVQGVPPKVLLLRLQSVFVLTLALHEHVVGHLFLLYRLI